MSRVSISQFHSGLGWDKHRKAWHAICDCNIRSSIFMKQHSRYCIKFWRRGDNQSILNRLNVNIQNIFIIFWVKYFPEMVHFIISNWFNRSGVWIWNRSRVEFSWKLWRVNLNITIINFMMIKYPHDSWNHRADIGRGGSGFEVSCCRLGVTLSWWFIWFFAVKGVELINLSYKTWWEEFMSMDDAGISLITNTSAEFANTLLSPVESCNNWLERWCIIFYGRRGTKIMRALTWSGQCFGDQIISS